MRAGRRSEPVVLVACALAALPQLAVRRQRRAALHSRPGAWEWARNATSWGRCWTRCWPAPETYRPRRPSRQPPSCPNDCPISAYGRPTLWFDALFTADRTAIFVFHGYRLLIHRRAHRRINHACLTVRAYRRRPPRPRRSTWSCSSTPDRFPHTVSAARPLGFSSADANDIHGLKGSALNGCERLTCDRASLVSSKS